MTASKHVTLWCDAEECVEMIETGEGYAADARRMARSHGWSGGRLGRDFCPAHSGSRTLES